LKEQREARLTVKVYQQIPDAAFDVRDIQVQRCHQYLGDDAPSDETLTDDLILAAYTHGLDGVSEIHFEKKGGLLQNCWYVKRAIAKSFRIKAE